MKFWLILTLVAQIGTGPNLQAQDLLKERIRKLSGNKTSVYIDKGIFHNGASKQEATMKSIRQSFNPKLGYERIVIDFNERTIALYHEMYYEEAENVDLEKYQLV